MRLPISLGAWDTRDAVVATILIVGDQTFTAVSVLVVKDAGLSMSVPSLRLVDERSCQVPDMWLKSVSLVSRRFAAEIRSVFFQVWCFTVFDEQKDSQSQPKNATSLPNTFAFLDALGADSKNLRRLEIYCSSDYEPVARAYERAFEGVTRLLHPDILVTLNVSVNEWDFRDGSALIGCRFDEH